MAGTHRKCCPSGRGGCDCERHGDDPIARKIRRDVHVEQHAHMGTPRRNCAVRSAAAFVKPVTLLPQHLLRGAAPRAVKKKAAQSSLLFADRRKKTDELARLFSMTLLTPLSAR